MNHVYRILWNDITGAWVAVAEIAKACGKRSHSAVGAAEPKQHSERSAPPILRILAASLALISIPVWALDTNALPTGGKVSAGSAAISQIGTTLNIQQNTQRAALDWQSFNIGATASVNFAQPSSSAVALNRILGNEASQIYGKLNSNGRVFFSNANGMLFARGAQVNVGGILATTLNLSNADFMAGNYRFTDPGAGSIRNEGLINALGSAALIGNSVQNAGQIIATTVTLAAGNTVAVDLSGDGLIRARVIDPALKASIENSGSIDATAAVTLTAGQAKGTLDQVVNNSGVIRATGFAIKGGEILLEGGQVLNAGTLNASSTIGKGGTVHLLGNEVGVTGTGRIDASGAIGGGTILIGGDAHGANPLVQNAQTTFIGNSASIQANATQNGDGGKVVVWADNTTQFNGNISAQGGANSGNGGWVEVSGKQWLGYAGLVNTTAANGNTGTLLLDPMNITISTAVNTDTMAATPALGGTASTTFRATPLSNRPSRPRGETASTTFRATPLSTSTSNLNVTTLQNQLALSNVTVDTTSPNATGTGNITVQNAIAWNSANSLTLNATSTGAIVTNAGATITNTGTGALSMLTANGSITIGAPITLAGTVNLVAGNTISVGAAIAGGTGVSLTAQGGDVNIGAAGIGTEIRTLGNITLTAGTGNISLTDALVSSGGTMDVTASGNLTLTDVSATASPGMLATGLVSHGNQTITVGGTLEARGATSVSNGSSGIASDAGQTIRARQINLFAGGTGTSGIHDSSAGIFALGNQSITAAYGGVGGIAITAGGTTGGYNNIAGVQHGDSNGTTATGTGNQTITLATAGSSITMQGGAGTGSGWTDTSCSPSPCLTSGNSARIENNVGSATIGFTGAGNSISITGGGATGDYGYNEAGIHARGGTLTIGSTSSRPNITLTGGSAGGQLGFDSLGKPNPIDNSANIGGEHSTGITIYAGNMTLNGGSASVGGAYIFGPSVTIDTTGNLTLAGGAGSAAYSWVANVAAIGYDQDIAVDLTIGGNLAMTSSASGSATLIGSIYGTGTVSANVTGSASLTTTGAGVVGIGSGGSTASAGSINVNGGITAAGAVTLNAVGVITQTAAISTPGLLTTSSVGGTILNGANTVGSFTATNSGSGNIVFTNTGILSVTGISNPVGAISVSNTGALTINGVTTTAGAGTLGNISFTALSPLTINADITASGAVTLTAGFAGSTSSSDVLTINGLVTAPTISLAANTVTGSSVPSGTHVTTTINTVTQSAADAAAATAAQVAAQAAIQAAQAATQATQAAQAAAEAAAAQAAPAPVTMVVSTLEQREEDKPAVKPVLLIIVIGNSTVQKPADQIIQVEGPKGSMLMCSR